MEPKCLQFIQKSSKTGYLISLKLEADHATENLQLSPTSVFQDSERDCPMTAPSLINKSWPANHCSDKHQGFL